MKVAELAGALLDYWVATAAGYRVYDDVNSNGVMWVSDAKDSLGYLGPYRGGLCWRPSEDWAHGGPIIELERIELTPLGECWTGRLWLHEEGVRSAIGRTPLVAAMRCFVTSKYGDDVPDQRK